MKAVSMYPEPLLPPSPTLAAPSTLAKEAIPAAFVHAETSKELLDALNPFSVAVKAMPDAAKIAILRDGQTRLNHPAWLTALKEDGLFAKPILSAIEAGEARSNGNFEQSCVTIDQFRLQVLCGTSSAPECLVEAGHPWFAALAMNLTTAKTKKPFDLENYDPDTGDRMQLAQCFRNHTGWAPSVLTDFRDIVEFFLLKAKNAPANLKINSEAFFPAQAALLMCAACAGGDAQSAVALMQAFPDVTSTFVSSDVFHLEGIDEDIKVSPAFLAVEFDQRHVLTALKSAGWDPLSPLAVKNSGQLSGVAGKRLFNFFDVIHGGVLSSSGLFKSDSWRPHVLNFFFETYMERLGSISATTSRHEPGELNIHRVGQAVGAVLNDAILCYPNSTLRPSILKSGVAALFANECLQAATSVGDIEMLAAMRQSITWPDHVGKNLPLIMDSYNEGTQRAALLLAQWCIEDGNKELLLCPGFEGLEDASNASPAHHFADKGFTEMLHLMLKHGLDPMMEHMLSGKTVLQCAEDAGQAQTAAMLRSHIAKQAMGAVLGELADLPRPSTSSRSKALA